MRHDIFLSYATSDNTNLAKPWTDQGRWVSCFKVALKEAVEQKLGRTGAVDLFFDEKNIRTGDELVSEIEGALTETALFVALLSPGYFHPESWCRLEREHFIAGLGPGAGHQRRVFGVLLDESVLTMWKDQCFPTVRAFPFYDKNQALEESTRLGDGEIDAKFLKRITTLARELADRLREFRGTGGAMAGPVTAGVGDAVPPGKGAVLLAVVPGELEDAREELAIALESAGWRVVPRHNEFYADRDACDAATRALLARPEVVAFVQYLGAHPWKPGDHDRAQFEAASQPGDEPLLVYRGDTIDLARVRDEPHKAWLEQAPARSMVQLKSEMLAKLDALLASRKVRPKVAGGDPEMPIAYVTLCVSPPEHPTLGRTVLDDLARNKVYGLLSPAESSVLEHVFLEEDGLLTTFGNETYDRVEQLLLGWRKLLLKHRRPPGTTPPLAIYLAQPPPADKRNAINLTLPGLRVVEWHDVPGFEGFIEDIRRFVAARGEQA